MDIPDPFGPFSAIYVGPGPQASTSAVLTQILCKRTEGSNFSCKIPQVYNAKRKKYIQSGTPLLRFDLTFLGQNDNSVMNMANGSPIVTSPVDTASAFASYTMVLMDSNPYSANNILIPNCVTVKDVNFDKSKKKTTNVHVEFEFQDPNRFDQLFRVGTLSTLAGLLGSRAPFS